MIDISFLFVLIRILEFFHRRFQLGLRDLVVCLLSHLVLVRFGFFISFAAFLGLFLVLLAFLKYLFSFCLFVFVVRFVLCLFGGFVRFSFIYFGLIVVFNLIFRISFLLK